MLETAGIPVWRDTADLWPGEDWRLKIRQAVTSDALVFIACFSKASLARDKSYQNEELVLAVEQLRLRRPDVPWLVPVRLDECDIPDRDIGGGRSLASIHYADLFDDHFNEGATRLVQAIWRILGSRTETPPVAIKGLLHEASGSANRIGARGQLEFALERLGSDQPAIRVGAALSLAEIAASRPGERARIAQVLSTQLRTETPGPGPGPDGDGTYLLPPLQVRLAVAQAIAAALTSGQFPGSDLSHSDLCRANLANQDLRDVDLRRTNLPCADLRMADMRGADLRGADLTGAKIAGALLAGAKVADAHLAEMDLTEVDLSEVVLVKVDMSRSKLAGVDLSGRDDLYYTKFRYADLTGANLGGTELRGAQFDGAKLNNADLTCARMVRASLEGAALDGTRMVGPTLPRLISQGPG